mgnify:CR=1 FL=1
MTSQPRFVHMLIKKFERADVHVVNSTFNCDSVLVSNQVCHSLCLCLFRRKGWQPNFANRINILISIDKKIYEWPDCSFAKMMYS